MKKPGRPPGGTLFTGTAESAPVWCVEAFRFLPFGLDDADEDALCEPLTAPDTHRTVRKVVDLDMNLIVGTPVILIDNADAIRYHQAFFVRQAAAGGEQEHIPGGHCHDKIGWNKTNFTRRNKNVLPAEQIESDRARCLMAR